MGENDLPDLGMNVLDLLQQKLNARFSELVFRLIHGRYAAEKVFALRHVVKADDRDILLSADLIEILYVPVLLPHGMRR